MTFSSFFFVILIYIARISVKGAKNTNHFSPIVCATHHQYNKKSLFFVDNMPSVAIDSEKKRVYTYIDVFDYRLSRLNRKDKKWKRP